MARLRLVTVTALAGIAWCCAGASGAAAAHDRHAVAAARAPRALVARRLAGMSLRAASLSCRRARFTHNVATTAWRCDWVAVSSRPTPTRTCRGTFALRRLRAHWRIRVAHPASCRTWNAAQGSGATPGDVATPASRTGAASPTKSGGSDQPQLAFGYNDNAVTSTELTADQDAQLAQEGGATVERITFDWRWAEPQPGQYQLGVYDQIYNSLLARRIKPLFVLLFAPSWAWDPSVSCDQYTRNCMYPPAATHFSDAANMAALLATRYPKAAGIEIWNEPNLSRFWAPIADPAAYEQLLATSYTAVKKANPAMPVVLGGLNNLQNNTATDSDMSDFLGAMYALGARSYMDAIAFHPYPYGADLTLATNSINEVLAIRHAFGDDARPIWATETGITTTDPALPVTESQQASGDVALYKQLAAVPGLRMIMINTLLDYGSDAYSREFGYGVVNRDWTPKPAFCSLASLRGSYSCASMSQALL